jgi:hypothetical protein
MASAVAKYLLFRAVTVLTGLYFSLRNIGKKWVTEVQNREEAFRISLPPALFITAVAVFMLVFFTD